MDDIIECRTQASFILAYSDCITSFGRRLHSSYDDLGYAWCMYCYTQATAQMDVCMSCGRDKPFLYLDELAEHVGEDFTVTRFEERGNIIDENNLVRCRNKTLWSNEEW